jgi:hypothetical protein
MSPRFKFKIGQRVYGHRRTGIGVVRERGSKYEVEWPGGERTFERVRDLAAAPPKPDTTGRTTIFRDRLHTLAVLGSEKTPSIVECDGARCQYVGIGWVDLREPPQKSDILVIDREVGDPE